MVMVIISQIGWECVWLPINRTVPVSLISDEHQTELLALHIIDTHVAYTLFFDTKVCVCYIE